MDQNAKKKLVAARKLIQEQKLEEALGELEIMVYKYAKLYQVHLMAALCYQKLKKYDHAQKAYLEVLDLKPGEQNAIKQLCQIYATRGDIVKSTFYLEASVQLLKTTDKKKYRETVMKLIECYQKDDNLEKIDPLFQEYIKEEQIIGEDFVRIAQAYFRVGVHNLCFSLQKFEVMGLHGQKIRPIAANARQSLNRLLVDIFAYLQSVAKQYNFTKKQMADSVIQMKMFFPEAASLLMLMFFDQFCMGQVLYSSLVLSEIMRLLQAYFERVDNGYLNLQYTQPETFSVCMIFSYEYLSFFKDFFTLDDLLLPYLPRLGQLYDKLLTSTIRQDYRKKLKTFILKQCRELSSLSRFNNIQYRLQELKDRILNLQNSFLQQVIAKIALNCVTNYDKINDLKNLLKLRIKNLKPEQVAPHLYKYYYEYLVKIAKIYKSLDEEIPLSDILEYITKYDAKDYKYHLEKVWFEFSVAIRQQKIAKDQIASQSITTIQGYLEHLQDPLKAQALRRIVVLKIFKGQHNIDKEIEMALSLQRSFQNLQNAGFYYFYIGKLEQSLKILRQAFRLNQMHYHTNRLLFLCLLKLSTQKQVISFLECIHQGFANVFWINFLLANSKTNQKKYLEAQSCMSSALQNFEAGSQNNFKFFYQRTKEIGGFAIQYMVQQNEYGLFFDEIIFPEEFIYSKCTIISNLYFKRSVQRNRMNLFMKEGELLKILGRTKSSCNYLQDAYAITQQIQVREDIQEKLLLQICLVRKQYATLLFYMRQFKQSEKVLYESLVFSRWLMKKEITPKSKNFYQKLDNEIKALSFEISVQRLSVMMRFESYQYIDEYLLAFKKKIQNPSQPSLNFFKNKYQFHILAYMHQRQDISELEASVDEFLSYFKLELNGRTSIQFENILFALSDQDRKAVRQCIEDYYIIKFLSGSHIAEGQLLHMLQLFTRSSGLLILFGMVTADVKLKTAAFLKCIQLDRESSISIDILASLYLRQKNYLAAAKLFLKSLQMDLLNVKCYLGLAICLFCLICRVIDQKQPQQLTIIRKCVVRINSYMEFMRVQDPSENYHLLSFLKLLLTEQKNTNFHVKLILQSAQRACHKYRDSLLGELLNQATKQWAGFNIWCNDEQCKMVENYINKLRQNTTDSLDELSATVVKKVTAKIQQLSLNKKSIGKQLLVKNLERQMNQLAVGINLGLKWGHFSSALYLEFIKAAIQCQTISSQAEINIQQLRILKYKIKEYLFDYLFLKDYNKDQCNTLQDIFDSIRYYQYLAKYSSKIPKLQREIAINLLKDPNNEELRKIYSGYVIGVKGHSQRKAKLSHKLEIINSNNQSQQNEQSCYKKLIVLYRDSTAFLLYIQNCWSDPARRGQSNIKIWLKNIIYLQEKEQIKSHEMMSQKAQRLKVEMVAYWLSQYESQCSLVPLSEYQTLKVKKLVAVNNIINGKGSIKQFSQLCKHQFDDFDWWILMFLVSWIARNYKTNSHFEAIITEMNEISTSVKIQGFLLLIKMICVVNREVQSEEDLVNQIVTLTEIGQQSQGKISPNTEVILECAKNHLACSWESIELQLARASEHCRITSYSDKILINFYEVIKQYKSAESNPNGEGVIQSFIYVTDCLLGMTREPMMRGFLLSLKGIIHSLTTLQQTKDRNIKMAIMLSPASGRSLLGVGH